MLRRAVTLYLFNMEPVSIVLKSRNEALKGVSVRFFLAVKNVTYVLTVSVRIEWRLNPELTAMTLNDHLSNQKLDDMLTVIYHSEVELTRSPMLKLQVLQPAGPHKHPCICHSHHAH